jgi:aldose 1-epimerase
MRRRQFLQTCTLAAVGSASWLRTTSAQAAQAEKRITRESWGATADGQKVSLYTLRNRHGLTLKITNYGGIVTSIVAPDRNGKLGEISLGFDKLDDYLKGPPYHPYFGCITGRYANRIARGLFTLDGQEYKLATNNPPNHLHGGDRGFDKVVWTENHTSEASNSATLSLSYTSPDGEEGYPGKLDVTVDYSLNDANEWTVAYQATTNRPTPVNLTNHAYFNLAGPTSGSILGHKLSIAATRYLPVDETLIPTGVLAPVKGTPFDFVREEVIGSRIEQVAGGYDHCFALDGDPGEMHPAATLFDPTSGRVLEIATRERGIQFYTGNFLDGTISSRGATFQKNGALCLETICYPDSPNQPQFPDSILRPGKTYSTTTVHRFKTRA